jgi:uncharacterized membrane protein
MMLRLDKALFISLVVAILAALGGIAYFAVVHQPSEKFTEFYILNPQGKAENYPWQVMLGADVDVTVGVVNHEYQPAAYRVEITINGARNREINVGTLAHEQKWEQEVSFAAQSAGDNQTVEFWLYKDNQLEPYLKDPLRLYIDVRQPD